MTFSANVAFSTLLFLSAIVCMLRLTQIGYFLQQSFGCMEDHREIAVCQFKNKYYGRVFLFCDILFNQI